MSRLTIIIIGYIYLAGSFMFDIKTEILPRLVLQFIALGFFSKSTHMGLKEYLSKRKK